MYIFRCVHVQRFIDTGADEIWLWFLWFNSSPEKWIIKSYTLYVKNHTVLQPVASPTPPPPFGLSVYKPYSDISDMLMPASQTTWSTRPCRWRWKKSWRVWGNKKLELWGMPCFLGVFGWLEVIYGRDWCSRKEGCERTWAKTHVECWNLLGLPGPSGFFESLREPEFLHIYCHCFFSLGGWEYDIYVEISAGGFIFQVEWGECFAFKVPMFPMISCETW